jgi:hypothetical protein
MVSEWVLFEGIARRAVSYREGPPEAAGVLHPFDERNIHPQIEKISKKLFDDGHYSQATFETYKLLDKTVQKLAGSTADSGKNLMMKSMMAIRNPRGHEVGFADSPDRCLDHLSLASLLFRRLEEAKP